VRREAQERRAGDERGEAAASGRRRSGRSRPRIVEGARASFLERGYVGTTMEGIAERAGVAVQTVYYVFGTKHSVLAAVLDASIVGDHEAVPLAGRDWMGDLDTIADRDAAFTHVLDACVDILDRTTPIYEVVCHASSDPEVHQLYAETRRRRRADQRTLVEVLHRHGHLRSDLDLDEAADTFYALVNEETFSMLTGDCGWSRDRFRQWLEQIVRRTLAGGSP